MKEGTFALIFGWLLAWAAGLFLLGLLTRIAWEILKFGWGVL